MSRLLFKKDATWISVTHSCSTRAKRTLFSAKSAHTLLCEHLKLIINTLFNALYFLRTVRAL